MPINFKYFSQNFPFSKVLPFTFNYISPSNPTKTELKEKFCLSIQLYFNPLTRNYSIPLYSLATHSNYIPRMQRRSKQKLIQPKLYTSSKCQYLTIYSDFLLLLLFLSFPLIFLIQSNTSLNITQWKNYRLNKLGT